MKRLTPVTLVLGLLANQAGASTASTLVTPHYRVQIRELCPEGEVACTNVRYVGTSRVTGKSITLKGRRVVQMCADGVTPCHPLGYEFWNRGVRYFVDDARGLLIVTRGKTTLVSEHSQWR